VLLEQMRLITLNAVEHLFVVIHHDYSTDKLVQLLVSQPVCVVLNIWSRLMNA
jgi:hypothetical protein